MMITAALAHPFTMLVNAKGKFTHLAKTAALAHTMFGVNCLKYGLYLPFRGREEQALVRFLPFQLTL